MTRPRGLVAGFEDEARMPRHMLGEGCVEGVEAGVSGRRLDPAAGKEAIEVE